MSNCPHGATTRKACIQCVSDDDDDEIARLTRERNEWIADAVDTRAELQRMKDQYWALRHLYERDVFGSSNAEVQRLRGLFSGIRCVGFKRAQSPLRAWILELPVRDTSQSIESMNARIDAAIAEQGEPLAPLPPSRRVVLGMGNWSVCTGDILGQHCAVVFIPEQSSGPVGEELPPHDAVAADEIQGSIVLDFTNEAALRVVVDALNSLEFSACTSDDPANAAPSRKCEMCGGEGKTGVGRGRKPFGDLQTCTACNGTGDDPANAALLKEDER